MSSSSFSSAYEGPGAVISVTAPYAVVGGAGCLVGTALFGVAVRDVASGAALDIAVGGEWSLAKNPVATAVAVGDLVYWDNTNKRLDTVSAGNKLVGVCTVAAGATDATCRIRITGQV